MRNPLIRTAFYASAALAVATALAVPAAHAQLSSSAFGPAAAETTDGNGITRDLLGNPGSGGNRYQQVYDASLFAAGPQLISEIQFRAANTANAFRPDGVSASDVVVTLSTTGVTADPGATAAGNFSASFADNIGLDATVVYDGPLTLTRGGSAPQGEPQPFEYGFTLKNAFASNPALGNLLLDVRVPVGATVAAVNLNGSFGAYEDLDTFTASNDGTASARGSGTNAVGAANQTGLATRFTTTVVPEPATATLAAAGVGLLALRRRRA